MRKLLVLVGLTLALFAAPAMAAVDLGLPPGTPVNFDGNGSFDQSIPGSFDMFGPLPATIGTELFGVGTISGVALQSDYGSPVWLPTDVGPNFEMTFVFWDAVVTSSARTWVGAPGASTAILTANYSEGARLLLVSDYSKDFTSAGGPNLFNLDTGEYPTAFTLGDPGYAGPGPVYPDDPDEEIFLDILLSGNSSALLWEPTKGFLAGSFTSTDVKILGGTGASQFQSFEGSDGRAYAFIFSFSPEGWAFGGDVDIQLTTIPEPATLIFLGTGLASLVGYRLRRRMA